MGSCQNVIAVTDECCGHARYGMSTCDFDFQVLVLLAPERQPGQPVFAMNGLFSPFPLIGRKHTRVSSKVRPGDLPFHVTKRNFDSRIVADAFVLPRIIARHEDELVVALGKPDRSANSSAILATGGEGNVLLVVDGGGDGHAYLYADFLRCSISPTESRSPFP